MRILFASAPGYGLTLPLVPLVWAARAAGHDVLLATTSEMATVAPAAGLPVYDVYPERDVWGDLMRRVMSGGEPDEDLPEEYRLAAKAGNPFGLFTVTMTAGTIAAGRALGADLVAYPSDHAAGMLTAAALDVPALEVGNRISWSMRDVDWRAGHDGFGDGAVNDLVRAKLDIQRDAGPRRPDRPAPAEHGRPRRGRRSPTTSATARRGGRCGSCPTTAAPSSRSGRCTGPSGPGSRSPSAPSCRP